MKRFFLLILLFVAVLASNNVQASDYVINDQAIDQLIDNAVETSMLSMNVSDLSASAVNLSGTAVAEKSAIVAIVLDFFLGSIGVHRFYLGTETLSGLAYLLTCGGIFGIVPLIDLIVLAINYNDISAFVNNPKFFMWKDKL